MVLLFFLRRLKFLTIALGILIGVSGTRSSLAQSPVGEEQGKRQLEIHTPEAVPIGESKTWLETFKSIEVTTPVAPGFRVSISGTVRDSQGNPVANALVAFREEPSLVAPYTREMQDLMNRTRNTAETVVVKEVYAKTTTDENGHYEFSDISVGGLNESAARRPMVWNVIAVGSNNQIGWYHLQLPIQQTRTPSSVKSDVRSDQCDIVLHEGTTVSGRLVDRQGRPASHVLVRVGTIDRPREEARLTSEVIAQRYSDPLRLGFYYSEIQPSVRTNEAGEFQLRNVPQNSVLDLFFHHADRRFDGIYVWSGPKAPAVVQTHPLGGGPRRLLVTPVTVEEAEAIRMTVRVANEDGTPIAGAKVWTNSQNRTVGEDGQVVFVDTAHSLNQRARTSRDQKLLYFQATPPEDSEYVSKQLSVPLEELMQTRKVEIVLPRGRQVEGTIADDVDGSPVAGATVSFFGFKSGERSLRWLGNRTRVKTDESGRFKATISGDELNGDLPAYAIVTDSETHEVFKAPSYFSSPEEHVRHATKLTVDSTDDSIIVPTIKLRRQSQLLVRVTDEENRPVAGANVELRGVGQYERKTGTRTYRSFREIEVSEKSLSNEEGLASFQLTSTAFDTLTIAADDVSGEGRRFARADFTKQDIDQAMAQEGLNPIQVVVAPGVTITGTVTVDDKPHPGVEVQLSRHVGPTGMLRSTGGFTSKPIVTETTNENGEYEFNVAPEGRFSVRVRKSPVEGGQTSIGYSPTKVGPRTYTVRTFAFESPQAIAATLTSVVGLVTDQDGNPLPSVKLQFRNYKSDVGRRSTTLRRIDPVATDQNGQFKLAGVRNEPITLWAIPDRTTYPNLTSQFADIDPSKPAHIRFDTRLVGETKKLRPARVLSRQQWKETP